MRFLFIPENFATLGKCLVCQLLRPPLQFYGAFRHSDFSKHAHSRLAHSYLLSGYDQPTCTKCDAVLTVKHILLDCPALLDVRLKYFTAPSLKDIFESVDNQIIIDFIKDAHFYHQL